MFDGLDPERDGYVCLAGANGSYEDDVASGGDPRAAGKVLDACALEAMRTAPVELRECFARRKACGAQAPFRSTLGTRGHLRLKQAAEEAERMLPIGESLSGHRVAFARDGRQLEHAQMRAHGGEDYVCLVEVAHAEHPAASSRRS